MPDIWSILLVVAGLFALVAGVMLATGNKPWSNDSIEPTSPPAGPDAEGMAVTGPGDIGSGAPGGEKPSNDSS
jgi:hypothetical protein